MTRLLAIATAGLVATGIGAISSAGAHSEEPDLGETVVITTTDDTAVPARRAEQPDVITTEDDTDPDEPGPTSDSRASWITRVSRESNPAVTADAPTRGASRATATGGASVDAPSGDATAGE